MAINTSIALTSSDALFERLGVGLLAVHGSTVIRASLAAGRLFERDAQLLIGRDLLQLFDAQRKDDIKAWLSSVYAETGSSDALAVNASDGQRLRLLAAPLEGGSASTRLIMIEVQHAPVPTLGSTDHAAELRRTLREVLDGNPVPTFLINNDHVIMHWNRACEATTGRTAREMIGTRNQWHPFYEEQRPVLADLVVDGIAFEKAETLHEGVLRRSRVLPEGLEAADFFPRMGSGGRWLLCTAAPVRNAQGVTIGATQTLVDISELKQAEQALLDSRTELEALVDQRTLQLSVAKRALEEDIAKREEAERALLTRYTEMTELNMKLADANDQIQEAQNQLVQNEKLASIGQLAAGVAHEINNPIGYVFSNFGSLENYISDMLKLIGSYREAEAQIVDPATQERLRRLREQLDVDFLQEDAQSLMHESREGIERVRKIVQDLKDFSHVDASAEWQFADIRKGLESTLNIAHNEIKYHAEVVREFGDMPQLQCLPSQLNQVFMNLVVNAGHALAGRQGGRIVVRTGVTLDEGWVEITDNGCGMTEETLGKIFDPFFTTKPIGQGTGLGLSLSYGIVQKHHGRIEVQSKLGVGTTFRVVLPIRQPEDQSPGLDAPIYAASPVGQS